MHHALVASSTALIMQAIADVQCVSAAEAHESICNHSGSCEDKLVCVNARLVIVRLCMNQWQHMQTCM